MIYPSGTEVAYMMGFLLTISTQTYRASTKYAFYSICLVCCMSCMNQATKPQVANQTAVVSPLEHLHRNARAGALPAHSRHSPKHSPPCIHTCSTVYISRRMRMVDVSCFVLFADGASPHFSLSQPASWDESGVSGCFCFFLFFFVFFVFSPSPVVVIHMQAWTVPEGT
ncbi:hypothetical protein FN846DRAFT_351329 [Sphaerosporella brunnea]|uniref:Uncharacterized protein n=1 Tax=Sphaerosporella brunnea TaxID=1250544 RepID=A0A5J5EJD7_9PEZI|nr:hypothetical protein FN846DRAFT_351329 [Sphaerosporella brunnea]